MPKLDCKTQNKLSRIIYDIWSNSKKNFYYISKWGNMRYYYKKNVNYMLVSSIIPTNTLLEVVAYLMAVKVEWS